MAHNKSKEFVSKFYLFLLALGIYLINCQSYLYKYLNLLSNLILAKNGDEAVMRWTLNIFLIGN